MPRRPFMALVTGGTKGIGYFISKELLKNKELLRKYFVLMTTRDTNTDAYYPILGMELGGGARKRSQFLTMDVTDHESMAETEYWVERYGGLNILVNNAAIYEEPDLENFGEQADRIIKTNYWGTKKVYTAFGSYLKNEARIINTTSNLAHVNEQNKSEEMELKIITRDRFADCDKIYGLDGWVGEFQEDARRGVGWCKEKGWPLCAYTVSKLAINAYTRFGVSFK